MKNRLQQFSQQLHSSWINNSEHGGPVLAFGKPLILVGERQAMKYRVNGARHSLGEGGTAMHGRGIQGSQRGQRFPERQGHPCSELRRSRREPHEWGGREILGRRNTHGEDLTS